MTERKGAAVVATSSLGLLFVVVALTIWTTNSTEKYAGEYWTHHQKYVAEQENNRRKQRLASVNGAAIGVQANNCQYASQCHDNAGADDFPPDPRHPDAGEAYALATLRLTGIGIIGAFVFGVIAVLGILLQAVPGRASGRRSERVRRSTRG